MNQLCCPLFYREVASPQLLTWFHDAFPELGLMETILEATRKGSLASSKETTT